MLREPGAGSLLLALVPIAGMLSDTGRSVRAMFDNLRADIDRHVVLSEHRVPGFILYCGTPALWATADYRARRWVNLHVKWRVLRAVLRGLGCLSALVTQVVTGIQLSSEAEIGKGFYIGHHGCIVVGGCRMGENCSLHQDVTIGAAGRGEKRGTPIIGDRVYIASGARIIGPVVVGNDVAIGANAVVTKSLPDRAVAVGVPAKVISLKGSSDFIKLRDTQGREQARRGR